MAKTLEERVEELERTVEQLVAGSANAFKVAQLDHRLHERLKVIEERLGITRP